MIVVADTGPLNYLILIESADILPRLYEHVCIPSAVERELNATATPEPVRSWIEHPPTWVRRVDPARSAPELGLDAGETQAISLALELHCDLLIDDSKGKRTARSLGIQTIGALGLLRAAARVGAVDLLTALDRLQVTSFRAPPELVTYLCEEEIRRRERRP